MCYRWVPMSGQFEEIDKTIVFRGETVEYDGSQSVPSVGIYICDQYFSGGTISAGIEFTQITHASACELIISHEPTGHAFLTAGLGSTYLAAVRCFGGQPFGQFDIAHVGDRQNLKAGHRYNVAALVRGSQFVVQIDGVAAISAQLPSTLSRSQVGIWCIDYKDIKITDFKVEGTRPKAFVVMQFTPPYNELYTNVINPVCEQSDLEVVRSDESCGAGIVIADIAKQIEESNLVIAEITPANPNVFYEVGYAHARNKSTILIAEKGSDLPFDVSPFRVLFYENSIAGKAAVEQGLRNHVRALLSPSSCA